MVYNPLMDWLLFVGLAILMIAFCYLMITMAYDSGKRDAQNEQQSRLKK